MLLLFLIDWHLSSTPRNSPFNLHTTTTTSVNPPTNSNKHRSRLSLPLSPLLPSLLHLLLRTPRTSHLSLIDLSGCLVRFAFRLLALDADDCASGFKLFLGVFEGCAGVDFVSVGF